MKQIITFCLLVLFAASYAQEVKKKAFDDILNKFVSNPDFKNASIGFLAYDAKTQDILGELNPGMSLIPASTLKLITTATALELFGKKYTFKTILQYDGFIDSACVLHGNIYIKGGGDPSLGSSDFKDYFSPFFMDHWMQSVKNLGIDSVDGYIIGDNSYFSRETTPATWIWGDMGNYFGAAANALSIYENSYNITFEKGDSIGQVSTIKSISPYIPFLKLRNEVRYSSENKDLSYVMGAPTSNFRYISGTIPYKKDDFTVKGSIPDPALLTAYEFENLLFRNNIHTSKGFSSYYLLSDSEYEFCDERKNLDTTNSPTLQAIITNTNLTSNNLYAEHLAIHCGLKKSIIGDTETGVKIIKDFWTENGIDTDGLYMVDGSGLSRFNAITPKQMADILYYMKNSSKNNKVYYESLPVAGKSGTLKGMCKGTVAEGKIHAKSGYITRARNYAGYASNIADKEFVFVIMVNNYNCTPEKVKSYIESLMIDMVNTNF